MGDTPIPDAAGSGRMIRGYIKPHGSPARINVFNLPAEYTAPGYDVYIYFDTNNPIANRQGRYTIGSMTTTGTDPRNVNFNGTFVNANGGTGNYVKLLGFASSSFTLTVTPLASDNGVEGAAVSGIQIVARNPNGTPAVKASTKVAELDARPVSSG